MYSWPWVCLHWRAFYGLHWTCHCLGWVMGIYTRYLGHCFWLMVSVVTACYLLGGVVLVMFLGSCCCASCVWCMQQVGALAFLFVCPAIVSCVLRLCPLVCVLSLCLVYAYNTNLQDGAPRRAISALSTRMYSANSIRFAFNQHWYSCFSLIFCFINFIPLNCECSQHSSPPCSSSLESYGWCSCNGPNQSRFESSYKASDISGQPWKEIMVSPVFWTLILFSPGKWNKWRWGHTLTLPHGNDLKWVAICETWQIKKEEVMWTCLYFMVYIRIPNIWVSSYED